ncbi:cytochrome c oxidase subunit II [Horticoccus luteus]|uniref:cytochrome-c oxidase n=1 Tax=Horticoccus luteus TaxID=2862869 RepID=A0A8F9TYB0_9BACT|nr:cytochrome c oxidase subunit II [Horticoccus luteus]QYM79983.1 cytochrome c oxidase subunit II [Horticoccus luteus]
MRLSNIPAIFSRWSRAAAALGTLSLLSGCSFWMDGHQSTIEVAGPVALEQRRVFFITCWVTLVIFLIVGAILAYATLKFRARTDADEHAEPPEQSHGNPMVELGLVGASVLALAIIAFPTLHAIWYTYDVPEAQRENAYEVTATGYQWWFHFEYPHEQIENVGPLITANELVVPAGRPIHVNLRTTDVIHSFWIPKLAGKVDMIPNRGNSLWFEAEKPGYFWGQCAEYCGESHAVMRFRVIALEQQEFNEWVAQQKQPARTVAATAANNSGAHAEFASLKTFKQNAPGYSEKFDVSPLDAWRAKQHPEADENPALIAEGRKLFQQHNCVTCHTVRGQEGVGTTAPNLTHVGARTTIAGGLLENDADQLGRWISHPDRVKPGNHMYYGIGAMKGYVTVEPTGETVTNIKLTDGEVHALVAYLQSLK